MSLPLAAAVIAYETGFAAVAWLTLYGAWKLAPATDTTPPPPPPRRVLLPRALLAWAAWPLTLPLLVIRLRKAGILHCPLTRH